MANVPPVAQFSLPQKGSAAPVQAPTKGAPPVAQFSLPQAAQQKPQDKTPFSSQIRAGIQGAAKVGDFLFPAVGDVYHDIKGDSTKTGLQQAGDVALSALPFVPGLGEAGEAARGGGLLAKLTAPTILKGAGLGYGAGVASNLSQGKGVAESFSPNVNTVAGTVLGGAAPAVTGAIPSLIQHASGITEQVGNALKDLGDPALYDKYINAAKTRATDVRAPSPLNLAADELDKAGKIIKTNTQNAGKVVDEAKNSTGHLPLNDITDAINAFKDRVKKDYGISLVTDKSGGVRPFFVPNRARVVPKAVQDRIINIAQQLNGLKNGTVRKASDVASNLSDLVDYSNADAFGKSNDPLEGLIKTVRHDVGDLAKQSSKPLADANARYHELKDLESEIGNMAGKNLQKGELLMRRVFSGDKNSEVTDFFNKIKNETGVDLVDHAVLAKHAIDTVGDASQKTLLQQIMQEGGAASGITTQAIKHALKVGQSIVANPESVGRRMVQGTHGQTTSGILPWLTKAAVSLPRAVTGQQ